MPAKLTPVEMQSATKQAIAYKKKEGKDYAIGFIQGLSWLGVLDAKQKQELVYAIVLSK